MTTPVLSSATFAPEARTQSVESRSTRNAAIDLTKGALVVAMFVYHSVNYFCHDKDVLRYLHFLPSSFIFIAGFLVTAIQAPKLDRGERGVHLRLIARGLKLLAIFVVLNVVAHSLFNASYNHRAFGLDVFVANLDAIFIVGGQRSAVFDVLLPISYIIIASGVLLVRHVVLRQVVLIGTAAAVLATCLVLSGQGELWFNLELLSMGLLGLATGLLPLRRVTSVGRRLALIVSANAAYAAVAALRYPTYAVNIAGVVLALLLFFAVGLLADPAGKIYRWLVLLGRYSLVGYIAQIAILQILFRALRRAGIETATFPTALVVTTVATTLLIVAIDRGRSRSPAVDSNYRFLFA